MTSRFAVAKDRLLLHLDDVVVELFGAGRQQSHRSDDRWQVANKWRADARISQMTIWRRGNRRGAWRDFVSGEKGDAIDLVAFALVGIIHAESRMQALAWVENRFGIRSMTPEARAEIERQAHARAEKLEAEERRRAGTMRERARKFFFSCQAEIRGTPVEAYLAARGIRLDQVPQLGIAFRFRPDCEYWPGAQRDGEGRKIAPGPLVPAMISAMVSADGTINACHYTFLEPDGSSKLKTADRGLVNADGRPLSAKLMFPATSGYVIRATLGPSGLSCEAAGEKGISGWVGITEGIEDALSAAIGDARLRMHAAGSLSGLLAVPDLPAARGYLIFKDNDWGKPQAQALFDQAMARFKSFGKPVEEVAMLPAWGKDVNDALNQEG